VSSVRPQRPHKVASLVLCNSFVSTKLFAEHAVLSSAFQFMPAFYLKCVPLPRFACSVRDPRRLSHRDYMLESFPTGDLDDECANAVDFVLEQARKPLLPTLYPRPPPGHSVGRPRGRRVIVNVSPGKCTLSTQCRVPTLGSVL
jgi:hypothetical protein